MSLFDERTMTWLREPLQALASEDVLIGTSSWKYPGWCGQLYDESRYVTRGRFSESRFEKECLEEFSEVFPTVCVDAGYYNFPSPSYIEGLCRQVPDTFQFAFKVTDTITIKNYPQLPRFGEKGGKPNEHFLNAELFKSAFLASCERRQHQIGLLIFEFSHFYPKDFGRGREFVDALDAFLSKLPDSYAYAVEVRNRNLLQRDYFAMLSSHRVAHVFNSWTRMPSLAEQIEMPGSFTTDFVASRLLLRPGRAYEQAVEAFSPYKEVKDANLEVRDAARKLVEKAKEKPERGKKRKSFLFVNNRLEGNALSTIAAIVDQTNRCATSV